MIVLLRQNYSITLISQDQRGFLLSLMVNQRYQERLKGDKRFYQKIKSRDEKGNFSKNRYPALSKMGNWYQSLYCEIRFSNRFFTFLSLFIFSLNILTQ